MLNHCIRFGNFYTYCQLIMNKQQTYNFRSLCYLKSSSNYF